MKNIEIKPGEGNAPCDFCYLENGLNIKFPSLFGLILCEFKKIVMITSIQELDG